MMTSINKPFLNIVFLIIFLFLTGTRPASAASDALALQGQFEQLNSQGEKLLDQMRSVRGSSLLMPQQLLALNTASTAYSNEVSSVATQVIQESGSVALTPGLLASMAALTTTQVALSREISRMTNGAALQNFATGAALQSSATGAALQSSEIQTAICLQRMQPPCGCLTISA